MSTRAVRPVTLGRIVGVYGVRGWVKVYSHTRPHDAILSYRPWLIGHDGRWETREVAEGRIQGKGIVARLSGYQDRDQAARLVGNDIAIDRSQLPDTAEHEYYWAELEGFRVINLRGQELGAVSHLFETGANDVLVVKGERERLIPFAKLYVQRVDVDRRVIEVDWDAED